jgi:hypothetical protein
MKILLSLLIGVLTMANTTQPPPSFHTFTMKDIRGKEVKLSAYK